MKTKNELKLGTTWSATKVWLRPVKAGLGGHEEGVFRVDEGVENISILSWKQRRVVLSVCATFNDIRCID